MTKSSASGIAVPAIFVTHLVNGAQFLNAACVAWCPIIIISPLTSRVRQLAYVTYRCMPNFIGVSMILHVRTLIRMVIFFLWIFKSYQNFSGPFIFIRFKNLYIWPLIYLFFLGRDRLFTVYICFKETLFFSFSYKLFNKYFSLEFQ